MPTDIADFGNEKVLIIKIRQSLDEGKSLYDATRVAWKVSVKRAEQADWIVAASRGEVLGVFQADSWLPSHAPEFDGLTEPWDQGRHGFVGREAPAAIRNRWVGRRLSPAYMRQGAASPIRYVNM